MTPSDDPLTELAVQLAALSGSDVTTVRDSLARDPAHSRLEARRAALRDIARHERPVAGGEGAVRLVLLIDQFEEAFTLNAAPGGETDRQRFITALDAMAASPAGADGEPAALVVIAVRGDFCDKCAAYAELADAMQDSQIVVGPMTESDLRLAITGPAAAAGLRLEPGLTDTILDDLRAAGTSPAAGVLPLLSQAMMLTWENRDGDRLTSHGYGNTGGVSRAVQVSADATYDALPDADQALAREILRSMTVADRDGRLTRRPVTQAALAGLRGSGQSPADAVVEKFAERRLIVLSDGTAEIAHDALLTAWPRLRGWLEDDQASWRLHSQLADDAAEWDARDRSPDFLYRGTQLEAVKQATVIWDANPDRYPVLSTPQQDFLHDSEHASARGIRRRRMLTATLVILLIAALTGASLAVSAALNANHQKNLAAYQSRLTASGELAAESQQLDTADPVRAAQLAAAAWQIAPTAQARQSMLTVLAQPERLTLSAVVIRPSSAVAAATAV